MTLSDQPFANLRNLLNAKNNVPAPRHGTAQVANAPKSGVNAQHEMSRIHNAAQYGWTPTWTNDADVDMEADRVAFGERMVQESIPFGSHSKEEEK